MSGVTSVKQGRADPSRKVPIFFGIIGLLFLATGSSGLILGLILIAVAVGVWFLQKPIYHVTLLTASGESDAHSSTDSQLVNRIVAAVNEAIVHRG